MVEDFSYRRIKNIERDFDALLRSKDKKYDGIISFNCAFDNKKNEYKIILKPVGKDYDAKLYIKYVLKPKKTNMLKNFCRDKGIETIEYQEPKKDSSPMSIEDILNFPS